MLTFLLKIKKEAERKKDDEGADLNGRTLGAYRDLLFYSNAYTTLGGGTHGWMKNWENREITD